MSLRSSPAVTLHRRRPTAARDRLDRAGQLARGLSDDLQRLVGGAQLAQLEDLWLQLDLGRAIVGDALEGDRDPVAESSRSLLAPAVDQHDREPIAR